MSVKGRLYYAHTFTRAQHNPYNAIAIPRDTTHNTLEASSVRQRQQSRRRQRSLIKHNCLPRRSSFHVALSSCRLDGVIFVQLLSMPSHSTRTLTTTNPPLYRHPFPCRRTRVNSIPFPKQFSILALYPLVASRLFRLSNLAIRWKVPRRHILQPAAVIQFNSSFDAPPRLSSALPCLPRNPCAEWADEYKVILCVLVILNRSIQISDKLQSIRNRLVLLY